MSKQWTLIKRPEGNPKLSDFELKEVELPKLKSGQIRVKNLYVSVDPYMRPKMSASTNSYTVPYQLGELINGIALGQVTATNSELFKEGDIVLQMSGWTDEYILDEKEASKIDPKGLPVSYFLSILGMTGATAYFGLTHAAKAKPGDILFVSAAAGAVGSTVVQIGKAMGMKVIGSAGGSEKVAYVKSLGADAVIDYKSATPISEQLKAVAPEGIDVYFDNVGGEHLDAALGNARLNARFAICGMISTYNSTDKYSFLNFNQVIAKRIQIKGFLYSDFVANLPEFHSQMSVWLQHGMIKDHTTIVEGIDNVIEAFTGLFSGKNTGKMLVKI